MERLPPTLIEMVFDELSIRDALHASYVSRRWHAMLSPYIYSTYNINQYLSRVFPDPASLLKIFRYTGAVMAGLRTLGYFLPSCRIPVYNSYMWEIVLPWPDYGWIICDELVRQQFVLRTDSKSDVQSFPKLYYRANETDALDRIEVEISEAETVESPNDSDTNHHTSVLTNFISGWGAGSVYWKPTFERQAWMAKEISSYDKDKDLIEIISRLGIKIVEPPESWNETTVSNDKIFVVYFPSTGKEESHAYLTEDELEKELEEIREPFNCKYHRKLQTDFGFDPANAESQEMVTIPAADYKALLQLAYQARRDGTI